MSPTLQRSDLLPGKNLIGTWREARSGRRFDVSDPATDTVFASVPDSGADDARAAVDAAYAAFPVWRAVPAKSRAAIIKRFQARAKGRGNRISKPTCHIFVTVGDKA